MLGWIVALAATAAVVVAAAVPWRLDRAAVGRSVDQQLADALGLHVRIDGPVTLKLLPRPRLRMTRLSVTSADGTVSADLPEVKAEVDIASVLQGRWRLASATLVGPTVTVDVDHVDAAALLRGRTGSDPSAPPLHLRSRAGVLRTTSSDPGADVLLTDVDATVAWPTAAGAFSTSGHVTWRGAPARFAGRIERLSDLMGPTGSVAALQITSPSLTLSADGVASNDPQRRFAGRVAALVPSLPELLQARSSTVRGGGGRLQMAGDVVAGDHALSFSNASFRLNKGRFEGALALRRDGGHTAVEGTLATDLLDIDGLLADEAGRGSLASLYGRPFAAEFRDLAVDLRVSASKARLGRVTLDEAAIAVLLRDGRLEVSLDEAGLCGGEVKGRAITRLGSDGAVARAEATATRVDVAALSAQLGGDGQVGGTLTGDVTVDGAGRNLREIVAGLEGHGQVTVDKGRLAGLSLARALTRFGAKLPIEGLRGDRPTVFNRAIWAYRIEHGVLKIPDGKLTAPGVAMTFSGETRLPDGRVDLAGTAVETDAAGGLVLGAPSLPFTMRGWWDGSVVLVGHAGAGGLPSLVLPLVGATSSPP